MAPSFCVMILCTWGEYENDLVLFTVGPALFMAGLAIRLWAQLHLRYRLNVKTTLTVTGPYHYVRNPIYIGNTVLLVGACWMSEILWFIPLLVANCALVYGLVVRYEEKHLLRKYGEPYLAYLRRTPRWFPRFRGADDTKCVSVRRFLLPSLRAEAVQLLYLSMPIAKELLLKLNFINGH